MQPAAYTASVDADGVVCPGSSWAQVPWWSFTKTLIAASALRLSDQGRLPLDEPVAGRPYTLRMLLQHRAGTGDYGGLVAYHAAVRSAGEPWSDGELFTRVSPERLAFAPGQGWAYSNIGYLLIRREIERAFGAPLAQAMRDLVLAPLGLDRSRLATDRAHMAETVFPAGRNYHPGWAFHGIVVGPVAEAALALHRLLRGDLLAPSTLEQMLTRHPIGGTIEGRPWLTTGYGLGVMMGTMKHPAGGKDLQVVGHSAGGPGSCGAVYQAAGTPWGATAAAFTADDSESRAEFLAVEALASD